MSFTIQIYQLLKWIIGIVLLVSNQVVNKEAIRMKIKGDLFTYFVYITSLSIFALFFVHGDTQNFRFGGGKY